MTENNKNLRIWYDTFDYSQTLGSIIEWHIIQLFKYRIPTSLFIWFMTEVTQRQGDCERNQ